MNQLDAMQIYLRVAELASFTQAAASLGVPKGTVSAAVQQLENELATRLLHRTTRKVQMTADGEAFYQRARDLLADFEELQGMFRNDSGPVSGRLRVDLPAAVARNLVTPRLPEFLAQHPELHLELSSSDRRVDLVREGFDCVLRVGEMASSSLIARPIGAYPMVNCASPSYLQRFGTPLTLADLSHHQLIHWATPLASGSSGFEYVDDSGSCRYLAMNGALTVNHSDSYSAACVAGLGIIQVPLPGVQAHLASGALVSILPQFRPSPMPISFVYPNRRHLPRRVRLFMAWVSGLIQEMLASLPQDHHPAHGAGG